MKRASILAAALLLTGIAPVGRAGPWGNRKQRLAILFLMTMLTVFLDLGALLFGRDSEARVPATVEDLIQTARTVRRACAYAEAEQCLQQFERRNGSTEPLKLEKAMLRAQRGDLSEDGRRKDYAG